MFQEGFFCLGDCEAVAPGTVLSPGQWEATFTCPFQSPHGGPVTCILRYLFRDLDEGYAETAIPLSYPQPHYSICTDVHQVIHLQA